MQQDLAPLFMSKAMKITKQFKEIHFQVKSLDSQTQKVLPLYKLVCSNLLFS